MSHVDGPSRACDLPLQITELLTPGAGGRQEGRLLELGPEGAFVQVATSLADGTQVALDFKIPIYPKEINGIAKILGREADGTRCRFVHLPFFETRAIETWVAEGDGPPPLAARARVG